MKRNKKNEYIQELERIKEIFDMPDSEIASNDPFMKKYLKDPQARYAYLTGMAQREIYYLIKKMKGE